MPSQISRGAGRLPLTRDFRITSTGHKEPRLDRAIVRLRDHLSTTTGLDLRGAPAEPPRAGEAGLSVQCGAAGATVQMLGEDEGYTLDVTPSQARLTARQPLGILRGLETFLQLAGRDGSEAFVPAVHIEDRPRFAWRGLLLDVARHFQPVENVKRTLDGMAAVKLNVLHWHLSDDQGFRVESKLFPRLHQVGSGGQYYTQTQIREVIEYARDRGIRVVPEFDGPGHATSWLVAYPQYGSTGGPYSLANTVVVLGGTLDPTNEQTYVFLGKVFGEMSRLFPDAYFHVGGDEVGAREWRQNRRIQRFSRVRKLKNRNGLLTYFNRRLLPIVSRNGKKMIGWDEILQPDLPKDVVIQSWRGSKSMARAAREGYRAVLSAGYYLDLMDPASKHYLTDPFDGSAAELQPEERARVLGGEACMWAEYVDSKTLDSRIWPRAAAIAERLWSPSDVRDVASMYERLAGVSQELTMLGLDHQSGYLPALQRLAPGKSVESLKVLADVAEPVKHYARGRLARERGEQDTVTMPLNRLVDAARPESDVAREFNATVDRYLASGTDQRTDAEKLRRWLTLWRDNDAKLQHVLAANPVLSEVIPLSRKLSILGRIGLSALDHQELTSDDRSQLEQAREQDGELLLMIVPGVDRLAASPPRS